MKKFLELLKSILKGMVIGVANIIPGVSGGTMAVSMGIYDRIIHAVTHLISEFKKSMKVLIPIGIGIALALVGMARVIEFLFDQVPFQTNLLFIGLILGGLPGIVKQIKGEKFRLSYALACAVFFAIVVGCAALNGMSGKEVTLTVDVITAIKLFGVGVIASATMVIPGVSGSMVLMIMGYYSPIISMINQFIDHLKVFDIAGMLADCGILVPFGIGVIVGIIVIAKIIEWIFTKCKTLAYWAIIGLIAASPVAILMLNRFGSLGVGTILTGILALAAGIFVAVKLGE